MHIVNIQQRTDEAVDPGFHLTALPPRADAVDPRCDRRPVTLDQAPAPAASYPDRVGSGAVATNTESRTVVTLVYVRRYLLCVCVYVRACRIKETFVHLKCVFIFFEFYTPMHVPIHRSEQCH